MSPSAEKTKRSRLPPIRELAILGVLYFVQGMPFGFQATALPVYLRAQGASLTDIAFASALSLPWMIKALWAPAVDRFYVSRLGRRRSWILPMQCVLVLLCVAAGSLPGDALVSLLALIFLMNLAAATMDIAVDGLAVDLLDKAELGYGNTAQVVGYKLGMLTAGGVLMSFTDEIGWSGLFFGMAGLTLLALLAVVFFRESPPVSATGEPASERPPSVLPLLLEAVKAPGAVALMCFIATYKLGESMSDVLFRPFLVDAGFSSGQIGLYIGTYGMVFSLIGSVLGGTLASRVSLLRAVTMCAVLRVIPIALEWWLVVDGAPTEAMVIGATCAEHLFGGALTTAMFAFMMSRVDRRIGATHYTVLATIEVVGKMPAAWIGGYLGDVHGYAPVFLLATVLSAAYLVVVPWVASTSASPPSRET